MRTRSSGPAKDPATGQIIPDTPQNTIPAFIHPPVPFNPFPEAAFPTLEFPVPEHVERPVQRRILSGNRNRQALLGRRGSPGAPARRQNRAQEGYSHVTGAVCGTKHILEQGTLADSEIPIPRTQSRQQVLIDPGEFQYNPYWDEDGKLRDNEVSQYPLPPSTPKKDCETNPTWSDLTSGVQIAIMVEMVSTFGLTSAPILLELSPMKRKEYIELKESEAQGQATEAAKATEYINHGIKQMLAGKLDGVNTTGLHGLQLANGSTWQPATFAINESDIKAGERFLLGLGFDEISQNLWNYHGMDVGNGYDFGRLGHTETADSQEIDFPTEGHTLDLMGYDITGQVDHLENTRLEVDPSCQWMPKAKRNLWLEKVKQPKKSRPPQRQPSLGPEPNCTTVTPSKLRLSVSADEIELIEPVIMQNIGPPKARVALQVAPGTDLSKPLTYTRPTRQWADVANVRRGSKEKHVQQALKDMAEEMQDHIDLVRSHLLSPVTPKNQKDLHANVRRASSENPWDGQTGRTSFMKTSVAMSSTLPYHSEAPMVKNVAGFANPHLAAKWARKIKPMKKSNPDQRVLESCQSTSSEMGYGRKRHGSFPGEVSLSRKPPEFCIEETISKLKGSPTSETLSPFDESTPGPVEKTGKRNGGLLESKSIQTNAEQQYVDNDEVPIETLNAGERSRTTVPQMLTSRPQGKARAAKGRNKGTNWTVPYESFVSSKYLMGDSE